MRVCESAPASDLRQLKPHQFQRLLECLTGCFHNSHSTVPQTVKHLFLHKSVRL
jgi:hypothetical protein